MAFAAAVLASRGKVSDVELVRVREAGFGNEEITEIVAHVPLIASRLLLPGLSPDLTPLQCR